MPDVNLNRIYPPGLTWYCFKFRRYCPECDCMGMCPVLDCPYIPQITDVEPVEINPT